MGHFHICPYAQTNLWASTSSCCSFELDIIFSSRFPHSMPAVLLDMAERLYISGFIALEIFVVVLPIITQRLFGVHDGEAWEFFPLMLRSVYCAVGLVWAYIRLSALYIIQKPWTISMQIPTRICYRVNSFTQSMYLLLCNMNHCELCKLMSLVLYCGCSPSSSSNTWSRPTFWPLVCFALAPHTTALIAS